MVSPPHDFLPVGNLQDDGAVLIQMAVHNISTLSTNDSDSPFFFFCCFLDFIFLALLSISTAVCLCVKPLRTTTRTQSHKTRKRRREGGGDKKQQLNRKHAGRGRLRTMTVIYHSSRIFSECLEKPLITDAEAGDLLLEDRKRLAAKAESNSKAVCVCVCVAAV